MAALAKKLIFPCIGIVLIGATMAQSGWFHTRSASALAAPAAAETPQLRVEGRLVTYPNAEAAVGTDLSGTITRVLVAEGDTVRQGQLLAELRSQDMAASVREAQAEVAQAAADVQLDQVELARAQKLWQAQVGTREALDKAERDLASAQARQQTAQATVQQLQATLDKSRIYAPISGTVVARNVDPGQPVNGNSVLFTIANLARTRIEAEVDEFDEGKVALNAPATIYAEGFPGRQWQGRVEEVPSSVVPSKLRPEDPSRPSDTRVLMVKIALAEKTPLKLGQRVQVEIAPSNK